MQKLASAITSDFMHLFAQYDPVTHTTKVLDEFEDE